MISDREQRIAAAKFAADWLPHNLGDEKQHTHNFWLSLLSDVFGVEGAYRRYIDFERKVSLPGGKWGYIDGYIPDTRVLIEQKSRGKRLDEKILLSDGSELTPAEQGMRYAAAMNLSEQPRWIIACNFDNFEIYDQEKKGEPPVTVSLANFEEEFRRLSIVADRDANAIPYETKLSVEAGGLIGKLYKALFEQYGDKVAEDVRDHSLNVLCVRLAFCLYAEDSGLFGKHGLFHDYLRAFPAAKMREGLVSLFEMLDTPVEERDPYADPELLAFPYVNGGLFREDKEKPIVIPRFTDEIAEILLKEASEGFDWRNISPTIFGAVFESTLNKETQRKGGMHYTSVENIHKVIDPLFLDDLKAEYKAILGYKVIGQRDNALKKFLKKLGTLTFLDPACGSGNFLTETFLSLRRLENDALRIMTHGQQAMDFDAKSLINVHIDQFYGIEINDFAVSVAKAALWIAEHQMMLETEDIIQRDLDFLPLKSYSNIHEGNALRMDWGEIVPKDKLNYIMGNPPFRGHQWRTESQHRDMNEVFGGLSKHGKLDYVLCWFEKTLQFISGSLIKASFVSTNSVVQGESVSIFWKHFFEKYKANIDFAYRTFIWDSEAEDIASVHCVIIGFSAKNKGSGIIFDGSEKIICDHINGYLLDGPNIFIDNRTSEHIDDGMPIMSKGSQPTDGGGLILSETEADDLIKKNNTLIPYIKRFMGAKDLINNQKRYCLWLVDASPSLIRKDQTIKDRLNKVRESRLSSPTKSVQEFAQYPYLFTQIRQPDAAYIAVPEVSSQNRKYIPIAILESDVIASNKLYLIRDSSLYIFSVLTSDIHMEWMRMISGRMKSDYSYSPTVYMNFPFPKADKKILKQLEECAKNILKVRGRYEDSSLADLYDTDSMKKDLLDAHKKNNETLRKAYGLKANATIAEAMSFILKLFEQRRQEKLDREAEAKAKAAAEKEAEKARKKAEKELEKSKKKMEKMAAKLKAKGTTKD